MIELCRTVRFCLSDPAPDGRAEGPASNTFSAWPAMRGLSRFYQLYVRCVGEADAVTGYFMNIKEIDRAVRDHALPVLRSAIADADSSAAVPMGSLMRDLLTSVQPSLQDAAVSMRLELTPFHQLEIRKHDMSHVILRQQYEFAAAHRLHCDELSDDENRRVFGKCNNPSGHGHNYRVEVAVRAPMDGEGHLVFVEHLDDLVDRAVIEKLDHKHLNVDVPEFEGMNTSVENISKVIYEMLTAAMAETAFTLEEVSVWETAKTVCTYRGEAGAGAATDAAGAASGHAAR